MKCLIIAAGRGSRLSKRGDSKPLVSLLGLPLIEHVILTASKSGLDDFYVVTGYNGEKVRQCLTRFSQVRNIKINHINNDEWEKENGLSVLKAKDFLDGNFILLMGDHIFDEEILKRLKGERLQNGEVILAVDYNTTSNSLVDINDVTKVLVENGKVKDIGKNLTRYNAYDTGMFLCSPAIFTAIETSIARNNDSALSGAIRIMSEDERIRTFDVGNGFWIDVDDEETLHKAERALIDRLKKPSDGPVSRYLNRPLSFIISKYFVKTDITSNQISFFSFLLSLIASAFFLLGDYMALATGGIIVQIASIIDGCDGEVARLKHQESDFGGWFDAVLDRYADAFILLGLTCYTLVTGYDFLSLFVGFMAIIGSFMNSYTADKYDGLMKKLLGEEKNYFRMGRDVRMFVVFIGAIVNQAFLTLLFLALLMNIENIRRVIVCYKSE